MNSMNGPKLNVLIKIFVFMNIEIHLIDET